jgi:hypothetical protein
VAVVGGGIVVYEVARSNYGEKHDDGQEATADGEDEYI